MGTSCVLKLSNTVVTKADINSVDASKLLDANHSQINEMSGGMTFVENTPADIVDPVIELVSSKLTVEELNVEEFDVIGMAVIDSSNNSMAYFNSLLSTVDLTSNPTWTDSGAVSPTYGNNMSYNILKV